MKKLSVSVLALALAGTAGFTQADSIGGFYVGAKTGHMNFDVSGIRNDRGDGLFLGYEWLAGDQLGIAVEYEYTTTSADARVSGLPGDVDLDTHALYAALRYGETVYFKAKAGILREEADIKVAGVKVSDNDTGFSGGVGAGYRFSPNFMVEVEYTIIEKDVDYLSIGAAFKF